MPNRHLSWKICFILFNRLFQNLQISSSYLGRRKKVVIQDSDHMFAIHRFILSFIDHIDSYFHRWSALGRLRYRRIFTKAASVKGSQSIQKKCFLSILMTIYDHQPPKRIQTIEKWNPTPSTKLLNTDELVFYIVCSFYMFLSDPIYSVPDFG